ncbi:MAG: N-acyl-D-amino-acid deacylase family protein, partial [Bilophila wadsworthia]
GVTTENLGLDGMSLAPIKDGDKADWKKHLSGLAGTLDVPWTWNSFAEYLDCLQAAKPPLNVSSYVGLGTVRLSVMGMADRPAEDHEIRAMRDLVARCMDEGARGISAGLIYPPSRYQSLEETVAVAKAAAAHGGIYDVHMRNEADAIAESVEEVIAISERSGIPAMITHFKIRGKKNWGRSAALIRRIDEARAAGIDVTMAQYPYTAGSTFLHVVIPPWYHSRGVDGLLRALREERGAIKHDLDTRMDWENSRIPWAEKIFVSLMSAKPTSLRGKSIADRRRTGTYKPANFAFDLLVEEQLAVGMISFGLDEADITAIMRHPAVSFITDGLMSGRPHPRAYATYPRILGRYVREQGVLSLEEAVRKMTSLPARKIRLRNKGVIAEGYDADLVVFDPDTVIDKNSYDDPRVHPAGIAHVLVNGVFVVEDAALTGARPGRVIRD